MRKKGENKHRCAYKLIRNPISQTFKYPRSFSKILQGNFQRILHLLIQNKFEEKTITNKINLEIDDIAVISDHIQFNFDRLDDLKENINSKIDLEQNSIFRTLTIITVCISLPTLIAGI